MPVTIHIVTPCLNVVNTIDQTIQSVLFQAGDFHINYHIQDGGSDDGTIEKIKGWQSLLQKNLFPLACSGITFTFESSPDEGMYDAITRGFSRLNIDKMDFMAWINGDDFFIQGSFSFIARIAESFPAEYVSWVCGNKLIFEDTTSSVTFENLMPTSLIKNGLCDGKHWNFVQQEGSFFRHWLWKEVDGPAQITQFKYAGDWNLWRGFAKYAQLINTHLPLAAFRKHPGQLTHNFSDKYIDEIEKIVGEAERSKTFKELTKTPSLRALVLKPSTPAGEFKLVERGANGLAHYHFHKLYGEYLPYPLDKEKDQSEKLIFPPFDPAQQKTTAASQNARQSDEKISLAGKIRRKVSSFLK